MSQLTLRLLRFTYKKLKANLTVSDSKTLFHEQFPYVIPSLFKRIVDEMLVELNLLNHQSEFSQDPFFCLGLTEVFNSLTNGYEPEQHLKPLFSALCKSTDFDPEKINEISNTTLEIYKDKSLDEISELIIKNSPKKIYYSRILILGIYKLISTANDFKEEEDLKKIKEIEKIGNSLNLPLLKIEKDISLFRSSIKKFEQAKALIKETIKSEREKRNK